MPTNNISVFLDVALSLTFFYFVTSMFVSGIVEFINTAFENRSYFLWYALKKLQSYNPVQSWFSYQMAEIKGFFTNLFKKVDVQKNNYSGWLDDFQKHPMIKNLECDKGKWRSTAVSYISSDTFVRVVRDMLNNKLGETTISTDEKKKIDIIDEKGKLDELKTLIEAFDKGDFKDILKTISSQSSSVKDFEDKLANWYNQYMDYVSGWFKRHTRFWGMGISFIVVVCLNLNTIVITKQLSSDKTLRDSIIAMAEKTVKSVGDSTEKDSLSAPKFFKDDSTFRKYLTLNYPNLVDTPSKNKKDTTINTRTGVSKIQYQEAVAKYLESNIQGLGLKMGYTFKEETCCKKFCEAFTQNNTTFWTTLLGWLLTTAALSFGAPFWFDILVKLVNVRNVMKKPDGKSN